jgi:anti-sigma regulatory factor (Ser/Thr protein kinase)
MQMDKPDLHHFPGPLKISLPAEMVFLPLVSNMTKDYAVLVGLSGEDIHKTLLAVEETVVNVIWHGFADRTDSGIFDMHFSISQPYGLRIQIRDKGIPFDPSAVSRYEPDLDLDEFEITGLGMRLIQKMMDRVEFRNLGRNGKEVVLTRYCPQPVAGPVGTDQHEPVIDDTEPLSTTSLPLAIRRLHPHEAIGVSRCAYKCHGYTFFNDVIYYPEKLRALNESNQMISIVAVTNRKEVIGHGALLLDRPETRIAEVDFVFVDLEYRQQNCLGRLSECLLQTAVERGLAGLYTYAITLHVYSQKAAARMGLSPVALLLATSPPTWDFKGVASKLKQRVSSVLYFRYLGPARPRRLYLPSRHSRIIQQIYAALGAAHEFVDFSAPQSGFKQHPTAAESVLEIQASLDEGTADIWLKAPGAEVVTDVRRHVRKLCIKGISLIILFVSMESEKAVSHIDAFEGLGFFFAGVLPETSIGDTLVLQYLNNVEIDYGAIELLPGNSEILLSTVRACDPNQV